MPHTDYEPHYTIQFTANEFRLVTLGLAGQLKDAEDISAARQLNTHLCHQRMKMIEDALQKAKAALAGAEKIEKGQNNERQPV